LEVPCDDHEEAEPEELEDDTSEDYLLSHVGFAVRRTVACHS
jgi:hypothetical protein